LPNIKKMLLFWLQVKGKMGGLLSLGSVGIFGDLSWRFKIGWHHKIKTVIR